MGKERERKGREGRGEGEGSKHNKFPGLVWTISLYIVFFFRSIDIYITCSGRKAANGGNINILGTE